VLILGGNQLAGGYNVDNSCRFNDGSSDYLNRTPASAGNRKTWTWSGWVKRGNITLGIPTTIFAAGPNSSSPRGIIDFDNTDQLRFGVNDGTWYIAATTALFRDPSAWYHIVAQIDFSNATQSDRVKLYVNNVLQTTNSVSWPSTDQVFNNNVSHQLGRNQLDGSQYLDGYLSEVCFIDGQALDPTSFGEFDEDSGIWKPISVSGLTFGTNGFYLPFENSAALGQDDSGNGNNFTVNNLTSIDQTTDTPTNNFATLNPLNNNATLSDGNTKIVGANADQFYSSSSLGVSKGKWYVEAKMTALSGGQGQFGITGNASEQNRNNRWTGQDTYSYGLANNDGLYYNASIQSGTWTTYTTNDIISIALDLDNNLIYFYKNGTVMNSGTGFSITDPTNQPDGNYFFAVSDGNASFNATWEMNFGNPPYSISSGNSDGNGYGNFEHAVPSGYYAINSKNLAEYG